MKTDEREFAARLIQALECELENETGYVTFRIRDGIVRGFETDITE